jgi:D-3-phosphoglycerate dehydrogenase
MKLPILGVFTPIAHIPNLDKKLSKYFEVLYYPDVNYLHAINKIEQIEYIFTNPNKLQFKFDANLLTKASQLKAIATASTGDSHIDLEFLARNGIEFFSLKSNFSVLNNLTSTAELAFLFLLSANRNFPESVNSVKNGHWDYEKFIGNRIRDIQIGVIGFGRLGKMFSQFCDNFGAKVAIFDPYVEIFEPYVKYLSLEKLFSECDAISIHVHLNKNTTQLINEDLLNQTKSNFVLINTSRGQIVNEKSIIDWIKKSGGHKYYADVLAEENINLVDNDLIEFSKITDQVIITPHIGGMTVEGQKIAYNAVADLLIESLSSDGR